VLVASLFVSSLAWANPVAMEDIRLRQVPHTHPVQISYVRYDSDFNLTKITRDGTEFGPTWTGGTYNTNMGSGVSSQHALQTCDCDVPVGSHTWEVTNAGQGISGTLLVLADAPDLVPADAGNPDAMPWEVPDPVELQGIDCAAKCSSVPADASTPLPGPDASEPPLPGPDAGEPPLPGPDAGEPAKTGGGCTQGLAPMAVGTLAAALLALGGLGLRRRRE